MKKINTWDIDFPKLPTLVLGIGLTNSDLKEEKYSRLNYKFWNCREWLHIQHQTAGVMCHQVNILGTILNISEDIKNKIKMLHKMYYETNTGVIGVTLDELESYRKYLKTLFNVDCNCSYSTLEEGIYPIDIDYLEQLTTEKLPENLDDLVIWESSFEKICGSINRWKLWIIGENSD